GVLGQPSLALKQVEQRPLVGYGFGTEDHVFVDRYYQFEGGLPENAYIGALLQLGVVGLVLTILLLLALGWAGVRALRFAPAALRPLAAACLAVLVVGALL